MVIMSFDAEKKFLPRGGVGAFYMSGACGKDLFGRVFLLFYGKNYGPRATACNEVKSIATTNAGL